eukprot:1148859-Pelagomonas_calceolata.AAC.11
MDTAVLERNACYEQFKLLLGPYGIDVLVFFPSPVASRWASFAIGRTVFRDVGPTGVGFRLAMKRSCAVEAGWAYSTAHSTSRRRHDCTAHHSQPQEGGFAVTLLWCLKWYIAAAAADEEERWRRKGLHGNYDAFDVNKRSPNSRKQGLHLLTKMLLQPA